MLSVLFYQSLHSKSRVICYVGQLVTWVVVGRANQSLIICSRVILFRSISDVSTLVTERPSPPSSKCTLAVGT